MKTIKLTSGPLVVIDWCACVIDTDAVKVIMLHSGKTFGLTDDEYDTIISYMVTTEGIGYRFVRSGDLWDITINIKSVKRVYESDNAVIVGQNLTISRLSDDDVTNLTNMINRYGKSFIGLYFEATSDEATVSLNDNGSNSSYSYMASSDGKTWSEYTLGDLVTVEEGKRVYFKGDGFIGSTGNPGFTVSGVDVTVGGSVMSLIDGFGDTTDMGTNNFVCLFQSCSAITDTSSLTLPATTLSDDCYRQMFQDCTGMTTAPALPATTLTTNCYQMMFTRCSSITNVPELPATTHVQNCYYGMFERCTSITSATINGSPISLSMVRMFYGCSNLNYLKVTATTWDTTCTNNWVNSVASTGEFYKSPYLTVETSVSGIPSGWTVFPIS